MLTMVTVMAQMISGSLRGGRAGSEEAACKRLKLFVTALGSSSP
eukprot:CAMPEP_0197640264 /NCGR_PEP_ID=MMETSP1338-20131121/14618_1 /TAXON_ID=43686 ORGANISM="Pelagodinium beii, Strain RCC1491" /NCGR_SAMPLE_ID=MMETSP1338 /ASSEMBLY_ACC=CAM_ASM_000754 /LENGTH=43 /DNA_ID= /DNA_START= /DNA_END= /DNA_ORIENTATION=